jgi:hypothetical protein
VCAAAPAGPSLATAFPTAGASACAIATPAATSLVLLPSATAAAAAPAADALLADALLAKLGKHTTGKGCLYIKKLKDVDLTVLEALAATAVAAKKGN